MMVALRSVISSFLLAFRYSWHEDRLRRNTTFTSTKIGNAKIPYRVYAPFSGPNLQQL